MQKLLGCSECGLIVKNSDSDWLHCPRCKNTIKRACIGLSFPLGLAIASFILFFPAMFLPILTFELGSSAQVNTMFESLFYFYKDGYIELSIIVFITAIFAPFMQIVLSILVLFPLVRGKKPRYMHIMYKLLFRMRRWVMLDVYIVAILVSIIKLNKDTQLIYGEGIVMFTCLMISSLFLTNYFSPLEIWRAYHNAK